ncbi:response regulator transcription factor [Oceanobacillus neutriphilus]|uniref:DNA-binding response regulator n=1 Tax=Oceanobacillus neutriphilus TaxID=531815 RepID=A0ABQ2P3C6_9BACI|nr:response regulator transcription factor [Oceanobacillus neutriphilus]GGP16691.1 DNA-binding response regulator [Oceanobacillus neutriphilus]
MNNKILIVEDDLSVSEMIKDYLEKEGYEVTAAFEGEEGMQKFQNNTFDLIILDIMMPKLNGIEVMKQIRRDSSVPILIVSAKDTDVEKVLGLELGADDYIAKPFAMIELSARVKSALRRATSYSEAKKEVNVIHYKALTIDINNYSVQKNGKEMKLTSKEFDILKLFLKHPNNVFTKAQIYTTVWNNDYFGDENVINVHIRRLREKIEDNPAEPDYIRTIWGIGYKLGE